MKTNPYLTYVVFREGVRDWRVWLVSTLTGDRKDCVTVHTTKRGAQAECKRLNKENEQ